MVKLIFITFLLFFSIDTYAKQDIDSIHVRIMFETGFFISKKARIKVNDTIVFNERIKTINQLGYAGGCAIDFTTKDNVTVKIGLFNYKLKKSKLHKYQNIRVNRFVFFNSFSYDQKLVLYN